MLTEVRTHFDTVINQIHKYMFVHALVMIHVLQTLRQHMIFFTHICLIRFQLFSTTGPRMNACSYGEPCSEVPRPARRERVSLAVILSCQSWWRPMRSVWGTSSISRTGAGSSWLWMRVIASRTSTASSSGEWGICYTQQLWLNKLQGVWFLHAHNLGKSGLLWYCWEPLDVHVHACVYCVHLLAVIIKSSI